MMILFRTHLLIILKSIILMPMILMNTNNVVSRIQHIKNNQKIMNIVNIGSVIILQFLILSRVLINNYFKIQNIFPDSPVQRQLPPSSSSTQSDASPFESRQPQTDRDYFVQTSQQLNLQQYSKNLNEQQFKQKNNQFRAQQQSCVQQKPIYFQHPSYLSPQQQSSYPQQQPPSNYQNPSTK